MNKYTNIKSVKLAQYLGIYFSTLFLGLSSFLLLLAGLILNQDYYHYAALGSLIGYFILGFTNCEFSERMKKILQKETIRDNKKAKKLLEKEMEGSVEFKWSPLFLMTTLVGLLLLILSPMYLPNMQGETSADFIYKNMLYFNQCIGIILAIVFAGIFTIKLPTVVTPDWMKTIKVKVD